MACAIMGALAPDLDLLYFYLVDLGRTHHHRYPTHWPLLWLSLAAVGALWMRLGRVRRPALLWTVFCLGGVLHVLLDTWVGDIWWLAPFVDRPFSLFTVPARYQPWWLNFVLHWSFAAEIAICACAAIVMLRRSGQRKKGQPAQMGTVPI